MKKKLHFQSNFAIIKCHYYLLKIVRATGESIDPSTAVLVELTTIKRGRCCEMGKTDIFEAAKYIVALHFIANNRYTCNRTKVEKLLSIADLILIKNGSRLFPNTPIFINACGIGYCVLAQDASIFPMDNIISVSNEGSRDKGSEIMLDRKNEKAVPDAYKTTSIDSNTKHLLESVFLKFGAFTAKEIGTLMDEFKGRIQSTEQNSDNLKYYVDAEKAKAFFESDCEILRTNLLAAFIVSYTISHV